MKRALQEEEVNDDNDDNIISKKRRTIPSLFLAIGSLKLLVSHKYPL